MRTFAALSLACAAVLSVAQADRPKIAQAVVELRKAKPAASTADRAKARELLQLSMGRLPMTNVRAIILQRVQYGSELMQQIKVEMSPAGKLHQVVISPLRFQGFETVDDGVNTRTYSPDDRSVIVQPSAGASSNDVPFRMALLDKNYLVRVDRKEVIAGRTALVVAAVPRNRELETRCYAIDEEKGFLLRLETCRENAAPVVHFEAKMVEFPASFPERTFRLDTKNVYVKKREFMPVVGKPDGYREKLGFAPIVPSALPYGFVVEEYQADAGGSIPALAVRVTDGLAKATVYQWQRTGSGRSKAPDGTLVGSTSRVMLLISGDLPEAVKSRILQSFLQSARERSWNFDSLLVAWDPELRSGKILFRSERE